MADETPKVAYVDDDGKTKERKAETGKGEEVAELPEPLGTDPAALGADGKEEYMTQKDAEKADSGK